MKLNISPDNNWVKADITRLRQVIANLISNAIKFTNEGGEISISMEVAPLPHEETKVSVVVRDTGIGLDKEEVQEVAQAKMIKKPF